MMEMSQHIHFNSALSLLFAGGDFTVGCIIPCSVISMHCSVSRIDLYLYEIKIQTVG
jgi:hypothetical protein